MDRCAINLLRCGSAACCTSRGNFRLLLQSFGAKQYSNLGIYLQRALLVSAAAALLIIVMWMQIDKLLVVLGDHTARCFMLH